MKKFFTLALSFCLAVASAIAGADQIIKAKGNRGIVKSPSGQYAIGDVIVITNSSGATVGRGKVINVSAKGVLIQAESGTVKPGYGIAKEDSAGDPYESSDRGGQYAKAVTGYLGFLSAYDENFVTFGADFTMGGFVPDTPNVVFKAGLIYSTKEVNGVTATILDIAVGGGYQIWADKMTFEFGGRLGNATLEASRTGYSASKSSMSFTPYASAGFSITDQMGIGGEFRYPMYSAEEFEEVDWYILLAGSYRF